VSSERVNTVETGNQLDPGIARLKGGGYVIVWKSGATVSSLAPYDACFQRYDTSGTRAGSATCVAGAQVESAGPSVIARADGGFTVTWNEANTSLDSSGVRWQDYDATGTAQGSIQSGALPLALTATPLAGGGYVRVSQAASGGVISFQLYAADGKPIGSPQPVGNINGFPALAVGLAGGGFAVVWYQNNDASYESAMTRAFAADGTPLGDAVVVAPNTLGPVNCGTNGTVATCEAFQNVRGAAATDDGGYIVVWEDGTGMGTPGDTFARQFLANGSPASNVAGRIGGAVVGPVAVTGSNEFAMAVTDNDSNGTGISALHVSDSPLR
jgi:large repetitive protein